MKLKAIFVADLYREAIELKSENGENPEYDRALVNLVANLTGCTQENQSVCASLLGIYWPTS